MGKIARIVVCGAGGTGKTSILEKVIYGDHALSTSYKTIEDTYLAQIDTDRGVKETVRIQDTPGSDCTPSNLYKHYFHFGEGFVLVFSVTSKESFNCIANLKKEIDRTRDKKDITIVAIGNKCDLHAEREVDSATAQNWAVKEKVRLYETSVNNRKLLAEPFLYLCSKMTQPAVKSTLLGGRRLKQQNVD